MAQDLGGEQSKRFYLQYSFPPFSVGEVGRNGAPGRREVGHGNLAERALKAAMPSESEFPYVARAESLIVTYIPYVDHALHTVTCRYVGTSPASRA